MTKQTPSCLVAMSGGIDSSVAAYLLAQSGETCVGATMRLYQNEDIGLREKTCCSLDDVEDARAVAAQLHIPYYVFDFSGAFRENVMDRFVSAYEQGITPNPCIDCNRHLKFAALFDRAMQMGCEKVATGHYVRIAQEGGRFVLKKALDPDKDQSYVLYSLTQEQLTHTVFPLGELTKPEVRRIAAEQGFFNAEKAESQDICFVPDGDYARFIETYAGKRFPSGDFLSVDGKVLGRHRGIIHYTVGQRRGLGIAAETPLYVVRIDPKANTVILGENKDLFSRALTAHDVNLVAVPEICGELRCKAKIRYRHQEQPCTVTMPDADTLRVTFDEPQRAITAGQSVVLYDGDTVLGGGVIAAE